MNSFEVLADPTRLHILEMLREGEASVNELVSKSEIAQSGVSRHLRILQETGFVAVRPVGQRRVYSLLPARFTEMDRWLDGYRALWETRLDQLEIVLEARKRARKEQS